MTQTFNLSQFVKGTLVFFHYGNHVFGKIVKIEYDIWDEGVIDVTLRGVCHVRSKEVISSLDFTVRVGEFRKKKELPSGSIKCWFVRIEPTCITDHLIFAKKGRYKFMRKK